MKENHMALKSFFFFWVFLGFTAFAGAHTDVTPLEAKNMIDTNPQLIVVDVREVSEYCGPYEHIPGALNYPWLTHVLEARWQELPRGGEVLVVCKAGSRSQQAANFLDAQKYGEDPYFSIVYDMCKVVDGNALCGMDDWLWETVGCVDTDGDGTNDDLDNCPIVPNTNQADADGDDIGDACDSCTDSDGDGFGNPGFPENTCTVDNCPIIDNPLQGDEDSDSIGDVCDPCTDTDGDGCGNPGFSANTCTMDNCPAVQNGPNGGTCTSGTIGDPCTIPGDNISECGTDGFCSMNQEDADGDCIGDVCDPAPNVYDPGSPDSYPPQGNDCGDACECEGNFDGDADVDGTDATLFKNDFGRNQFSNPCTTAEPCKGDFICDTDVDGSDAMLFKADFGRSGFENPCANCIVEPWCVYP